MRIVFGRSATVKLGIVALFAAFLGTFTLLGDKQKATASASGPSASHTDAPGEDNCTSCHADFPVNSGTGNVQISGIPVSYAPGQQIPITVTTSQSDAIIFGFQLTAIDSLGRRAGTFTLPVQNPAKTQIINGIVDGNNRQYVEHTISGLFTDGVNGSNSWTFTWTAPAQPVGKISFYVAGNGANSDTSPSGDNIYTTFRESTFGSPVFDFDGDGRTDIGIFRPGPPTGAEWWYQRSSDGQVPAFQFGASTDKITPGDFTGDGKTDIAFFRPSTGFWFVLRSEDGSFFSFPFGANGDVPVPADYDADGKTDPAVFRPSSVTWFISKSTGGTDIITFGAIGDLPVAADYDGDGRADIAIWRPSVGEWWIQRSTAGILALQFGASTDKTVQGDYTGDGKADIAFWRPSTGFWFILRSEDNSFFSFPFGGAGDIPVPGDYDGDGRFDAGVFRPSETNWYILRSTAGTLIQQFGAPGDLPVPSAFVN